MIKLTLETINIREMVNTSGIFIGPNNVQNGFRNVKVINEVVGSLFGNENKVIKNHWLKTKKSGG